MFLPWSLITGRPKTETATRRGNKQGKPLRRPHIKLENLEDRVVPANYFVDATFSGASTGSLTQPFKTIQDALDAAKDNPGTDNVYVYGNNANPVTQPLLTSYVWTRDGDGNDPTLVPPASGLGVLDGNMDVGTDATNPVNMFFRASILNTATADGSGGAAATLIVKMRDNIVDVRDGSQLRIEGTDATHRVIFTSFFDDTAGGDSNLDGSINSPDRANWGGIRYRAEAVDQGNTSATGSFVNYADIRYTGGTIFDEIVGFPSEYGSIRMEANATNPANVRSAQVRVWNTVFNHGGRALDININALGKGGKASSLITGPDLGAATAHPLTFNDNSINGAFIFIPTNFSTGSLQQLDVNATLDDVGVPYAITKRFIIAGPLTTPGLPAAGITLTFNQGIVFKSQNTGLDGIEFGQPRDRTFGTIVVDGTANRPVLFTSLTDDALIANTDLASLYNNGSADTNNDGNASTPAPGDWGGIRIAQGNIDHAMVRYGGGFAEVSGTFVNWPSIRVFARDLRSAGGILQKVRVSNTEVTQTFSLEDVANPQNNADSPAIDLFSRDDQDDRFLPGTPFLRTGDVQIIDNNIHDNQGKAIQAHPMYLQDARNSMGGYGVFLRRNVIAGNSNNGLYVPFILDLSYFNGNNRGAIDQNLPLVGAVMDDTDIVTTIDGQLLIVRPDQYFAMMSRRTVVPDPSSGGYLARFTDPTTFVNNLVLRLPGNLPTDPTKPMNLPLQQGPLSVNPGLVDSDLFYYQTSFDTTSRGVTNDISGVGTTVRGEEWRDWGVNFNYNGLASNIADPLNPFIVTKDPSGSGAMIRTNSLNGDGSFEMTFPNSVTALGFYVVNNPGISPNQRIELFGADGKLIESAALPQTAVGGRTFFGRISRTPIYKVRVTTDAGATLGTSFASSGSVAIPDNGTTVESSINVGSSFNINSLSVKLNIVHSRASDLVIDLVAPDGTVVNLANRSGGTTATGANYTNTWFDNSFSTPISAGVAPFSGNFSPASYNAFSAFSTGLALFNGKNAQGTWKLRVRDASANGAAGTITNVTLNFKAQDGTLIRPGITGLTWVDAGESLVVKANGANTVITAASVQAFYDGAQLSQGNTGNIVGGFVPTMDDLKSGVNAVGQFTFGQATNTQFTQNTPKDLQLTGDTFIDLQIDSDFVANNLTVDLNLNYSGPTSQLRVQLQGPDGSRIDLVSLGAGRGNGNQSFVNTTFDDRSEANLSSFDTIFGTPYQSPYDSSFTSFQTSSYATALATNPTQTTPFGLGFYRGKNVRGKWSLIVTKNVAANAGTVQSFSLNFRAPVSGNGGTLRILGQGANPVILTGLADDTAGAGPVGHVQYDTGSDGPSTANPGQWGGIQILPGVNTAMSEVVTTNANGTLNRRYADLNPYTRRDEGLTYPGLNNPNGVLLSTQDKVLYSLAGNNDGTGVATRAPFDSYDYYNLQDGTLIEYADIRFATTGVDVRTYPKTKLSIDGNEFEQLAEPNGAKPGGTEIIQPLPELGRNYNGDIRFETSDGTYTVAGNLGGSSSREGSFTDDVDWYELPSDTPFGVTLQLYIDIEQGRRVSGTTFHGTPADEPTNRQINVAVFNNDYQLIYWSGDGGGLAGGNFSDTPKLMGNTLGPVTLYNGNQPYNMNNGYLRDAKYIAVMPFDRAPRSFFLTTFNTGVEAGLQPADTSYFLTPFQSDRMSPVAANTFPQFGADGGEITLVNAMGQIQTITNDSIIDFPSKYDGTTIGGYEMNLRFDDGTEVTSERNLNSPKPAEGQILIRSNTIQNNSGDGILLQDSRMNVNNTNLGATLPTQAARFPVLVYPNRFGTAATNSTGQIFRNEDVNNTNPSQSSPASFIPGPTVQNNLIINNKGNGIELREDRTTNAISPGNQLTPTSFAEISNNTIDGNAGTGILLQTRGGPTVQNNIVSNNLIGLNIIDGYDITNLTPPVVPVVSYNIFYNNPVTGNSFTGVQNIIGNSSAANPLYVDPSSQDYRIRPTSPAIDSAVSDLQDRLRSARSPQQPTRAPGLDLRGRPRVDNPNRPNVGSGTFPFYDRGALEANELSLRVVSLSLLSDNNIIGSPVSSINIVFSGRVDLTTFNANSFSLRVGSATSTIIVPLNFNNSPSSYDKNSDTHTFNIPLITPISNGTYYLVINGTTTGTGLRDISGQLLDGEFPPPYNLPSGDGSSGGTFIYPFTISTGTISGTIWRNDNGNSNIDSGEPGIAGVTVNLFGAGPDGVVFTPDDVTVATQVTTSTGAYSFANLGSGQYYVSNTTLPANYRLNTPPALKAVNLGIGSVRSNLNFGYWVDTGNAVVKGRVYNDISGNGQYTNGEPVVKDGLGNPVHFLVTLTSGGDDFDLSTTADNVVYTTFSLDDGTYQFDGAAGNPIYANNYSITIDNTPLPTTYVQVEPSIDPVPFSLTPSLSPVPTFVQNFGYQEKLATVTGLIFNDADGSGTLNGGEVGIANVTVRLLGAGLDGIFGNLDDLPTLTTTTNASGNYSFFPLTSGLYRVVVDATSPVLANSFLTTGNATQTLTLNNGNGTFPAANVGYRTDPLSGQIAGIFFNDLNADGQYQLNEPGFNNINVNIRWAGRNGILGDSDDQLFTATTNSSGAYGVAGLPVGDFYVSPAPNQFNGYALTGPATDPQKITLGFNGTNATSGYFGYLAANSSISGFVFNDLDGNGSASGSETGRYPGVVVFIDANSNGIRDVGERSAVASPVTGVYTIDGLPANPAGYKVLIDTTTLPQNVPAGFVPSTGTVTVPLGASATVTGINLGLQLRTSKITGQVFIDSNNNGVFDVGSEIGSPNQIVTVTFTGSPLPGNFNPVQTFTTGADGKFDTGFVMPAGTYTVQTTVPNGGSVPALPGNPQTFSLSAGASSSRVFPVQFTGPQGAGLWYFTFAGTSTTLTNSDGSTLVVSDTDVVRLAAPDATTWHYDVFFRGANFGLTPNSNESIDAFTFTKSGELVISTKGTYTINTSYSNGTGSGTVLTGFGEDLIRFTPGTPIVLGGGINSGTWSRFFVGSRVGLSGTSENVDAVSLVYNGNTLTNILLSTAGVATAGTVTANPQDVISFKPTSSLTLGTSTAGTFSRFFVGTAATSGLNTTTENVDALFYMPNGTKPSLFLSTTGNFTVPVGSGNAGDILRYNATAGGPASLLTGAMDSIALRGSSFGHANANVTGFWMGTTPTDPNPFVDVFSVAGSNVVGNSLIAQSSSLSSTTPVVASSKVASSSSLAQSVVASTTSTKAASQSADLAFTSSKRQRSASVSSLAQSLLARFK